MDYFPCSDKSESQAQLGELIGTRGSNTVEYLSSVVREIFLLIHYVHCHITVWCSLGSQKSLQEGWEETCRWYGDINYIEELHG